MVEALAERAKEKARERAKEEKEVRLGVDIFNMETTDPNTQPTQPTSPNPAVPPVTSVPPVAQPPMPSPIIETAMAPAPAPVQGSGKGIITALMALIAIALMVLAGFYLYLYRDILLGGAPQEPQQEQKIDTPVQVSDPQTSNELRAAYGAFRVASSSEEVAALDGSLESLRAIAADASQSNFDRARALNGINFAYTETDFDADTVRKAVFSAPPFAQYYVPSQTTEPDPLHPEAGSDVAALESALVKLNELSNQLYPNHYAVTRMEVANIFAFQRAIVGVPEADRPALKQQYAEKIKKLAAEYDSFEPISSVSGYSLVMRMQIMFAHASALAFVGDTFSDKSYHDKAEALFQETIAIGDAHPTTEANSKAVRTKAALARIFYVSYFWKHYRQSDPNKMRDIIRPITLDSNKDLSIYTDYLPSHKDADVAPFTVLRGMSNSMPLLRAYLEEVGWKFESY
jgi:hypothetical protein